MLSYCVLCAALVFLIDNKVQLQNRLDIYEVQGLLYLCVISIFLMHREFSRKEPISHFRIDF